MQEKGISLKSHGNMSEKQSDYIIKKKCRLHNVALLIPSNSEHRLIKDQRTCGGKIHKPMGKRKTK